MTFLRFLRVFSTEMMIRVEHLLATSILGFIIICLIIYFDRSSKRKTGEADEFCCDSRNSNMKKCVSFVLNFNGGQCIHILFENVRGWTNIYILSFIFFKKKKRERENQ